MASWRIGGGGGSGGFGSGGGGGSGRRTSTSSTSPTPAATLTGSPDPNTTTTTTPSTNRGRTILISSGLPATSHFPIQWSVDAQTGLMVLSASVKAHNNQQVLHSIQQEEDQCSWRAKQRMKTFGIVCALCLNLGTDPPDVTKVPPHAVTECGVDATRYHPDYLPTVLSKIAQQLEQQYRDFQGIKVRLKICPDPIVDEVKRSLVMMRKNAQGGRVVFHFNGHGVPMPTQNGEVWVYNEEFSQYIPVSIFDLTKWAGSPSVFVFDSNHAGILLPFFQRHFADQERKFHAQLQEWQLHHNTSTEDRPQPKNYLVLCACGADETLPTSPVLPGDLFTACLTVPVPTALKWFIAQHPVQMQAMGIEQRMVDLMPAGESRKSMRGELAWIFSTLTDTLAYSVFPPHLFQRLFREDVTMSNLFHNYLLAERIFRQCGRRPCTLPALPETWKHMLWDTWDYTVERSLMQLPGLIPAEVLQQEGFHKALAVLASQRLYRPPSASPAAAPAMYAESRFFRDQLLAFENWLTVFPLSATSIPPLQLPVILQLVISKQHRNQALSLLAQFLDQSPQAISQALAVGLFPYILKSLKTIMAGMQQQQQTSPPPSAAASPSLATAATATATAGEEDPIDDVKANLLRICVRIITFQPLLTRELFDYSPFFVDELKLSSSSSSGKTGGGRIRGSATAGEDGSSGLGGAANRHSLPALACFVLAMICQLQDGGGGGGGGEEDKVKNALLALDMDRIAAQHVQPLAERKQQQQQAEAARRRRRPANGSDDDDDDASSADEEEEEEPEGGGGGKIKEDKDDEDEEDDVFVLGASPTHSNRRLRRRRRSGSEGSTSSSSSSSAASSSAASEQASSSSASSADGTLIVWACLLLARFWQNGFEPGRSRAYTFRIVHSLERLLSTHRDCRVREAAAHALGMLFGSSQNRQQQQQGGEARLDSTTPSTTTAALECDLALRLLKAAKNDASPLVRREILLATSRFVLDVKHIDAFRFTIHVLSDFMGGSGTGQQQQPPSYSQLIDRLNALISGQPQLQPQSQRKISSPSSSSSSCGQKYMALWMDLSLVFTVDPFPALSQTAQILVGRVKSLADSKWASLQQQQQQQQQQPRPVTPPEGGRLLQLLESDLFDRAQYLLARPLKEVEEERFRAQMKAWETKKQNQDAQKTEQSWGLEAYLFVNTWDELACCEWYSEDELEAFGSEDSTLVKEPFFRLFRNPSNVGQQQPRTPHGSGGLLSPSAATATTTAPPPPPLNRSVSFPHAPPPTPSNSNRQSPAGGPTTMTRQQPDTVRRFDELPVDLFNSTSSTKLRRSTTNLPGLLARQSSQGSSLGGGSRLGLQGNKSSPNLLPMLNLVRQSSNSSVASSSGGGGGAFATKSPNLTFATTSASSSPSHTRQFVELDRIEFVQQHRGGGGGGGGAGSAAVLSAASSTTSLDAPSLSPPAPPSTTTPLLSYTPQQYTCSFHPYSPHFLLANETTISVFEAENFRQPVSVFSNFNLLSQINALTWIDSTSASPLLLVSTDDGQCRVWRDVTEPTPKLASAFSPTAGKQNDFQVDWLPSTSHLVCVSGSTLKTWDLVSELPSWECDLDCAVTSLSASEHSSLFVAGFANGAVRLFDLRVSSTSSAASFAAVSAATAAPASAKAASAVNGVSKLSKNMCFASASRAGEVRVWEARKSVLNPMLRVDVDSQCKISFHENAPMYAYAPRNASSAAAPTPSHGGRSSASAAAAAAAATVRVASFDGADLAAPIRAGGGSVGGGGSSNGSTPNIGHATSSSYFGDGGGGGGSSSIRRTTSSSSAAAAGGGFTPSPATCAVGSRVLSLAWHTRELALSAVSPEGASVLVYANTRVRGVWTPSNFDPEPYRL